MRIYILIALSILCFAAASAAEFSQIRKELLSQDVATRNSAVETLLLDLVEKLRKTMLTGSDEIPVLDPLEVEYLHLDEKDLSLPGSQVTVTDLKLTNLSTFVVDALSVNAVSIIPQRYRVEFDVYVPDLYIDAADYNLSVIVAGFTLFGNGSAKINATHPRVNGSLVIAPRFSIGSGLFLSIQSCQVSFAMKAFNPNITGLQNDQAISNFINSFLTHLIPELLVHYEPNITHLLSVAVLEIGNEILSDLNLATILG